MGREGNLHLLIYCCITGHRKTIALGPLLPIHHAFKGYQESDHLLLWIKKRLSVQIYQPQECSDALHTLLVYLGQGLLLLLPEAQGGATVPPDDQHPDDSLNSATMVPPIRLPLSKLESFLGHHIEFSEVQNLALPSQFLSRF